MRKHRTRVWAVLAAVFLTISVLSGTLSYVVQSDLVDLEQVFGGLLGTTSEQTAEDPSSGSEQTSDEGQASAGDDKNQSQTDEEQGSSAPSEEQNEEQNTEDTASEEEEPLTFDRPVTLRAVTLQVGVDILPEGKTSEEELRAQLKEIINNSGEYGINAFVIDSTVDGKLLYASETGTPYVEYDVLKVVSEVLAEQNIYLYINHKLNVALDENSLMADAPVLDDTQIEAATATVKTLVNNYKVASIILDGYNNHATTENYAAYRTSGGGVGYDNWKRLQTYRLVESASAAVRETDRSVQVSLRVGPVWAYADTQEGGIGLASGFQSLTEGFADTRMMVENGLADNLFVENYGSLTNTEQPFETVSQWWTSLTKDTEMQTYFILANDKVGTDETGWSGVDQLARQAATAAKTGGNGVLLRSLSAMFANEESTAALFRYFDGQLDVNSLFTDLTILSPEKVNTTTYEDKISFYGIADPNFDIYINGEKITLDSAGRFVYPVDLEVGSNRITFESKGTKLVYTVFRKVQLIKAVSPTGTVSVDGGTVLTIEATAYRDASVYATINGTTVSMSPVSYGDGGENTMYGKYVGKYTVPASQASAYSIGAYTVRATWNGTSEAKTGASVTVNRRVDETVAGKMFRVKNNQSLVYPTYITDYTPLPHGYTLPAGSIDYIVGDKIYLDSNYSYYKTLSGVKVRTSDIEILGDGELPMNTISGISVDGGGTYTDITFHNSQNVTYSVESKPVTYPRWEGAYWDVTSYTPTTVEIVMNYTSNAPSSIDVSGSRLFSSCTSQYIEVGGKQAIKYTLTLRQAGKYYGLVKTTYNGTNLTLRFLNPVSVSSSNLSGLRVYVDPGHSAADLVTGGAWNGVRECTITNQIGKKVVAELQALGATVMTHDNLNENLTMAQRVQQATNFGAHVYISIHINGVSSSTPHGPCVFYFYPTDYKLAKNLLNELKGVMGGGYLAASSELAWSNGYYVTRNTMMPGVLAEYGFGTNASDFAKLTNSATQTQLAKATVRAIVAAYS